MARCTVLREKLLSERDRRAARRLQGIDHQGIQLFWRERASPDRHGFVRAAAGDRFSRLGDIVGGRHALPVAARAILPEHACAFRGRAWIDDVSGERVQLGIAQSLSPRRHGQVQAALADDAAQIALLAGEGDGPTVAGGAVRREQSLPVRSDEEIKQLDVILVAQCLCPYGDLDARMGRISRTLI